MIPAGPIDLTEAARRLVRCGAGLDGVRLGIDVVDVQIMARQLSGTSGQRFLQTRFTVAELADSSSRADRIAARWAAKEAVAKAIGTGFRGLRPAMIEVVKALDGQPSVRAVGDAVWPNDAHNWNWVISLAHDGDVAIAVAMAVNARESEPSQTALTPPHALSRTDVANK